MPNTISNLLIGIGFQTDKKSMKGVESGLDSIKSKAIQLGAILAGAFGAKAITADFANAKDQLGKFAQVFGVSANDVNAFGQAIEHEGGTLSGFMSQLEGLEKLRAGIIQGDADFIAAAGRSGIDTGDLINATNAVDGFIGLADQFQRLSTQERLNAADALGLDQASIRLLSKGRSEVERLIDAEKRIRPVTQEMTKLAADFNDETQELFDNIGGFADKISAELLPQINNLVGGMNDFIDANRDLINLGLDDFLKPVADNFLIISGALAAIVTGGGIAALRSVAGIFGVGAAGVAGGGIARAIPQIAAAGAAASVFDWQASDFQSVFGVRPPDWLFQPIGTLFDSPGVGVPSDISSRIAPTARTNVAAPMPPININLKMDERVISDVVIDKVGEMNDQAIQDLTSSTAG